MSERSAQTTDPLDADQAAEQIYGGWLGRAVGCCLGKPVEGWKKARIETYLTDIGALPLNDYIPFSERLIANALKSSTRGNITTFFAALLKFCLYQRLFECMHKADSLRPVGKARAKTRNAYWGGQLGGLLHHPKTVSGSLPCQKVAFTSHDA